MSQEFDTAIPAPEPVKRRWKRTRPRRALVAGLVLCLSVPTTGCIDPVTIMAITTLISSISQVVAGVAAYTGEDEVAMVASQIGGAAQLGTMFTGSIQNIGAAFGQPAATTQGPANLNQGLDKPVPETPVPVPGADVLQPGVKPEEKPGFFGSLLNGATGLIQLPGNLLEALGQGLAGNFSGAGETLSGSLLGDIGSGIQTGVTFLGDTASAVLSPVGDLVGGTIGTAGATLEAGGQLLQGDASEAGDTMANSPAGVAIRRETLRRKILAAERAGEQAMKKMEFLEQELSKIQASLTQLTENPGTGSPEYAAARARLAQLQNSLLAQNQAFQRSQTERNRLLAELQALDK